LRRRLAVARREKNADHRVVASDDLCEVKPVHVTRHHQVGEDEIGHFRSGECLKRLPRVTCHLHPVAMRLQDLCSEARDLRVVLDDEDGKRS
jgi:hypothetical protein